ncbi:HAMP domain-containing sensor histidine kinase [Alteromonas sp. 1_MG-2023]|uniref:sensor histidine kinase n=1 Tax=Alteromonas sp. 1_MG-2023 TaxID=3062669 RepID=UPI0026E4126A|nr:HAMP domain-containing sensor histidine kinase [Alteromonas sp. 1_MG-2023]MDO6475161.1 HAMP domain-containing sensor histidine kinase [Alteromonas sp. 1_MG-2023]
MSAESAPRLAKKLNWVLGLLATCFITLFSVVPVFVEDQMEVISLHHWLDAEARRYVRSLEQGDTVSVPDSLEFDIYWQNKPKPAWLDNFTEPGFYEVEKNDNDRHFLVRTMPNSNDLFYVVFKDQADDYLDDYEDKLQLFILLTVASLIVLTVLICLYLGRYFTRPLERMQAKVRYMEPDQPDFQIDSRYFEIASVEQAMLQSKQRIKQFFEREQDFSRFTSHEIRTPLMVLQGSAQLLNRIPDKQPLEHKAVQRILAACDDISLLTDTFLLLGKEHIESQFYTPLSVEKETRHALAEIQKLMQGELPECQLTVSDSATFMAPSSFTVVALRNIIKNAYTYAGSTVTITIDEWHLTVANDIAAHDNIQGYGYGLVILERICAKMQWQLEIRSEENWFEVNVTFR